MSRFLSALLVIALMEMAACGDESKLIQPAIRVTGVYGSTSHGVSANLHSEQLRVEFESAPTAGQFIALNLPESSTVVSEIWTGDENVLHLVVPVPGGLELGVYPLRGYTGQSIQASLELASAIRDSSSPPIGTQNTVDDLTITELVGGQVRLQWTEVNKGDYNADGQVNMPDIAPVGIYFNADTNSANWNNAKIADGNADGRVSISDLVPIAVNYLSEVSGYNVKHGAPGDPQPLPVVVSLNRNDFKQPPFAPQYEVVLSGDIADQWAVAPFDRDGIEGTGSSDLVVDRIDVRSSISFTGSDLWSLIGSASGPLAVGSYIMRIVDPGDEPGRSPIVPPIIGPLGVMLFDGLPRQQQLMADFVYAPVVDPVTGGAAPYTSQWITSVPFALPSSDQQLQIDAAIELVAKQGGGFYIDSTVTKQIVGEENTLRTRLDPAAYLVASDTTHNWTPQGGGFGDEAWLTDSDRDGVSDALWQRQLDYNNYNVFTTGKLLPIQLRGTVSSIYLADGKLVLGADAEFYEPSADLWGPVPGAPILVRFSEQTNFAELVHPGLNQFERNFDPSTVQAGDYVLFYGYQLVDPTTTLKFIYWADRLLRQVP